MAFCRRLRALAAPFFMSALFVGAFMSAAGGSAAAQALFQPATTADVTAASSARSAAVNRQAARQRLVRVDLGVLARHVVPSAGGNAPDRLAQAQRLDGIVRMDLFADVAATFRRTDVSVEDDGVYTWEGIVDGKAFHDALLVIKNGRITGRVQLHNRLFRIDPVAGQVHRITELDAAKFPPEAHPRVRGNLPQTGLQAPAEDPSVAAASTARTTIRVLVAYTNAAQLEAGSAANIVDEINQAVALANQAYRRGGIPIDLVLAGAPVKVVYNEGADIVRNLNNLTDGASFLTVRNLRTARKADLVSLFRKTDPSFCGVAWLPGGGAMPMPSAATKETGYSVLAHTCVTNLSFHHELGHNMGLNHDRYVSPGAPNSSYNFGYVNFPQRVRTVMAYNDRCVALGSSCTRVNWFSSPTRKAQPGDIAIGKASNTAGAADNTLRLKQTRTAISNYLN
jgi:hypothetical protein